MPWDLSGVFEKCCAGCIRDEMQFNLDDVRAAGSTASNSGCGFLAFLLRTRHSVENKRIIFVQMAKNDANFPAHSIGIGSENGHPESRHSGIGKWRLPVSRKPPSVLDEGERCLACTISTVPDPVRRRGIPWTALSIKRETYEYLVNENQPNYVRIWLWFGPRR